MMMFQELYQRILMYESIDNTKSLFKGYVFPTGEIFDAGDHADAWDDIPSSMNHKEAIKYVNHNGKVILQGKLNKKIANVFASYGIEPSNIKYGSVDDEMAEVNKKTIRDKIDKLGWVSIGGGYKAIPKIITGTAVFTHIKTPSGDIYKDRYGGGVTPQDIKMYGGVEEVLKQDFYVKVSENDFINYH